MRPADWCLSLDGQVWRWRDYAIERFSAGSRSGWQIRRGNRLASALILKRAQDARRLAEWDHAVRVQAYISSRA